MKIIDNFSLAKHEGEYNSWPLKTDLLRGGEVTGKKVSGYVLEAQFQHDYGFLIITSWDCPFEEAQTISYLSPNLELIAEKTVPEEKNVVIAPSIWFERYEIISDHEVKLSLSGGLEALVTIVSKKTMKLQLQNT